MTYAQFKTKWNGKRVADPLLGQVGLPRTEWYQCVSLIKQYLKEGWKISAGFWGDAIDYWTHISPEILKKFSRIQTTDCKQGDIVILRTNLRSDYSGEGHIGICDHQDSKNVWLLEQNGATGAGHGTGNDAIKVWRSVPKSRIAGVLRPKASAPKPVLLVVKSGWGLSLVAKTAGFKDWWLPTAWIRISKLNGYGVNWLKMNNTLKPNQKVRVK